MQNKQTNNDLQVIGHGLWPKQLITSSLQMLKGLSFAIVVTKVKQKLCIRF